MTQPLTRDILRKHLEQALIFLERNPKQHDQLYFLKIIEGKEPCWCVIGRVIYTILQEYKPDFNVSILEIVHRCDEAFNAFNKLFGFDDNPGFSSTYAFQQLLPATILDAHGNEMDWIDVMGCGNEADSIHRAKKLLEAYDYGH